MRKTVALAAFFAGLLVLFYDSADLEPATHLHLRVLAGKPDFQCTALIVEVEYEERPGERHVACETPAGDILDVDTEDGWDDHVIGKGILKSGLMDLECESCVPMGSKLRIPPGQARLKAKEGKGTSGGTGSIKPEVGRRKLAVVTGTRTVLAVKVDHSGPGSLGSTTDSWENIAKYVFGEAVGAADNACLRSQMLECSHGELDFQPALNKVTKDASLATNITHGTTTVFDGVTDCTTLPCDSDMRNNVNSALGSAFGVTASSLANHVMHCLPSKAMSGIAYAYVNSWHSVYSDQWCQYLSAQMHEIGHNLNLAHSSEAGETYADQSGLMGYSYSAFDAPRMCFNAAKSWQLGWYEKYHHQFNLADRWWQGVLVGISQIRDMPDTYKAVVKINSDTSTDFYVNYNSRTNFNLGTQEGYDQVLIVKAGGEGGGYAESQLLAKLSPGQTYIIPDLGVTVTVKSIKASTSPVMAEVCIVAPGHQCGGGCVSDLQCDDADACTTDTCDVELGICSNVPMVCAPSNACVTAQCVEGLCQETATVCDDGNFCNGVEICDAFLGCQAGTPVDCSSEFSFCGRVKICEESTGNCVDNESGEDGTCTGGLQNCHTCPNDCPSFAKGAICGNNVCEDTEDCYSCPEDCNGMSGGKPSQRWCCEGGPSVAIAYGVSCSDARCTNNGNTCSSDSVSGGITCCGDGTCEAPQESFMNCPADCGSLAPTPYVPPSPTLAPIPPTACPVCGNGQECCSPHVCETGGNPKNRVCVSFDTGPSPDGVCPVCGNGDVCCPPQSCETGGNPSNRRCI